MESNNVTHSGYACLCPQLSKCKAHAPYYHLWPALLYNIFHIIRKRRDFLKKLLIIMCVVSFSLQILPEMFLILRKTSYKLAIILGRF